MLTNLSTQAGDCIRVHVKVLRYFKFGITRGNSGNDSSPDLTGEIAHRFASWFAGVGDRDNNLRLCAQRGKYSVGVKGLGTGRPAAARKGERIPYRACLCLGVILIPGVNSFEACVE